MPKKPPTFRPAHYRTDTQRRSDVDKHRGTTAQRGYGGAWQRRRKAYLMANPICVRCGHPANEVDHIKPLSWGGADEEANYQALCKPCHSAKTARERGSLY
jgi:5-methylcytosine-specific restriction enzyme A